MTLHVALVGCGNWGRYILRDLKTLGCRVSVVSNGGKGDANARNGGADAIVATCAELGEVAAAVVAVQTSQHAAVIDELLPRGIPIYCEKPLSDDLDAAERLVERAGERIFVMDKWRYHLGILELARIARSGELGPVLGLQTLRVNWGNAHPDVNPIWTLLPHDLSIALEIFGQVPQPSWARAEVGAGVVHGMRCLFDAEPWLYAEVGMRTPERLRRIELVCRDGVALLAGADEAEILICGNPKRGDHDDAQWQRRRVGANMPLLAELADFVNHVRGGPPPRSSAAEGLATVRAVTHAHVLAGIAVSAY